MEGWHGLHIGIRLVLLSGQRVSFLVLLIVGVVLGDGFCFTVCFVSVWHLEVECGVDLVK